MSKYHVRYTYRNKTALSKLPAKGRGHHEVTLAEEPSEDALYDAIKAHLVAGMEAQGWTDNEIAIIDVYQL